MKLSLADLNALSPDHWPASRPAMGGVAEAQDIVRSLEPGLELRAIYSLDDFRGDEPLAVHPVGRSKDWSIVARIRSSSDDLSWMHLEEDLPGTVSGIICKSDSVNANWEAASAPGGIERYSDRFGRHDETPVAAPAGVTVLHDPLLRHIASATEARMTVDGDLTIDGRNLGTPDSSRIRSVALMVAAASEYLAHGADGKNVRFLLPTGTHFLLDLCAARALRWIAAHVLSGFGFASDAFEIWGIAGGRTKASDRATHQIHLTLGCAAAILGSCDRVVAEPFDETGEAHPDSLRLAINVPRVLRYESHLGEIEDGVFGAYYVEALTGAIVGRSWEAFLAIEDVGGLRAAARTGRLGELFGGVSGGAA